METIFMVVVSGFFGLVYHKLEKMEVKIDVLESDVARLGSRSSKRSSDPD
jgi:hypothetical protein